MDAKVLKQVIKITELLKLAKFRTFSRMKYLGLKKSQYWNWKRRKSFSANHVMYVWQMQLQSFVKLNWWNFFLKKKKWPALTKNWLRSRKAKHFPFYVTFLKTALKFKAELRIRTFWRKQYSVKQNWKNKLFLQNSFLLQKRCIAILQLSFFRIIVAMVKLATANLNFAQKFRMALIVIPILKRLWLIGY